MSARIADCWCHYCGHPVLARGVDIDDDDDTDRRGKGRERCSDTACESDAVATYRGGVLVVAEVAS